MRMNCAKKVRYNASNGKCGYGWIVIEQDTIYYRHCNGVMPLANDVMMLLLADKDVRRLAEEYITHHHRKMQYQIERFLGMSGCADIYINILDVFGGSYHIIKRKKLLHISCAGKLNQKMSPIYIGDFVELLAYVGDDAGLYLHPRKLRRICNFTYVKEHMPIDYCTTQVTNIFNICG